MNEKKITDSGLLYEKYAEMIYKYLFSLCNDCSLAEELTQETFYQAIKSLHKYNGTCKVSTWLCEIAKRMWYKDGETVLSMEELIAIYVKEEDVAEANLILGANQVTVE